MSKWASAYFCKECELNLSGDQVVSSVCPYCGNTGSESYYMVPHTTKVRRFVVTCDPPWWKFWEEATGHWEYKEGG
jgi:hypothetical protein